MQSSSLAETSAHVPAWKRLGLKLKYAQETKIDRHDSTDSPLNLRQESTAAKDFKFGDQLSDTTVLPTHNSTAEHAARSPVATPPHKPPVSKKRKRDAAHSRNTDSINGKLRPTRLSAEQSSPSSQTDSHQGSASIKVRRKSVTFTPDTKTEDGNSTQKLFSNLVADQADQKIHSGDQSRDIVNSTHVDGDAEAMNADSDANIAKRKARKRQLREQRKIETTTAVSPYVGYLQQFHTARDQWKFNKNQQNQLLKHAFNLYRVPEFHDPALEAYIAGLQGLPVRKRLRETAIEILEKGLIAPEQSDQDKEAMEDNQRRQQAKEDALQRRLQNHDARRKIDPAKVSEADSRMKGLKRKRAQMVLSALSEDHPLYPVQAFVKETTNNDDTRNGTTTLEGDSRRIEPDGERRGRKRMRKQRQSGPNITESLSETSSSESTATGSEESSSSQSESTSSNSESDSNSSGRSSSSSERSTSSGSNSGSTSESRSNTSRSNSQESESDEDASDDESQSESDNRSTSSSSSSSR